VGTGSGPTTLAVICLSSRLLIHADFFFGGMMMFGVLMRNVE
jgi:hypothetical protein